MAVAIALAVVVEPITELVKAVISPFLRHLGYLVQYKRNVNELRNQMDKLEKLRTDVERSVEVARGRGHEIKEVVRSWLDRVDATQREVRSWLDGVDDAATVLLLQENKGCCCFQWDCGRAHYRVDKEAKRKTIDVVINLLKEAGQFDASVSIPPPPPPGIESMPSMLDFQAFEPTKLAMEQIIEALVDKKFNFIGVYGMGGVGKTTMMNELAKKLKNEGVFDQIVMVTVSQNIILNKIQADIAENLGFKFEEANESVRARRLSARIEQEKRILIILDDLWEPLKLTDIGILYGYRVIGDIIGGNDERRGCNNCSVIITTRFLEVCDQMNTQYNVEVKVLPEADAWKLFGMSVGADRVDSSSELNEVAKEVVKECGGLLVALVTVGKALRNKDWTVWVDALAQLKRSIPSRIPGMEKQVFSSIKLSYDYLESEETQRCFLFCCLFPEDFIISEDDLIPYVWAEDIFEAIENMKEEDQHGFVVKAKSGLEEWPNMVNLRNCKRLSLMQNEINTFPEQMGYCSQLVTISLLDNQSLREIPDGCFEGMKSLKVLDLRNTNIVSIPSSFSLLTEQLRVLHLNIVESSLDLSLVWSMKKLEILDLSGSNLRILPQEIGGLTNLKSLDLSRNSGLIIPPKVLSMLSRLEELHMLESFDEWEADEGSKKDGSSSSSKACLSEVTSLTRLTRLELVVSNIECLMSSNTTISLGAQNLTNFFIGCPFNQRWNTKSSFKYYMPTEGNYEATMLFWKIKIPNKLSNWVKMLLGRTKRLILHECHGPKTIYPQLSGRGSGLNNLRKLIILKCEDVEHILIVDHHHHHHHHQEGVPAPILAFNRLEILWLRDVRNLRKICHGPFQKGTLENLRFLYIERCSNLKHIFQMSMAQGLPQLEEISIGDCNDLEEIFMKNERGEDEEEGKVVVVVLPRLKFLGLSSLPNFSTVCRGVLSLHGSIKFPVLEELNIKECPNLRRLPISSSPESTPRLREIYVQERWFNQLEWDEPSDKLHLQQRVQNMLRRRKLGGLQQGLRRALKLEWEDVEVWTDCKNVVDCLTQNSRAE
ncbi:disease resistance protein At4g27190-like [Telopea speciosissima]|uniref:disease resistance protein At4g27190-like n=1 Tax=Telopea speciosissima TaxID=54955 RepID=UPI001CC4E732|nr:disease resistance protein At4g27190-like [Telopea speciosissima]